MKVKATLLLLALTTTFSFTQSNYKDNIFWRNGNIARGLNTEQFPENFINIETDQSKVFIQSTQIDILNAETHLFKSGSTSINSNFKPGYKVIVEYGFGLGVGDNREERMKLNFICGYQINPFILIGSGIGLRYYLDAKKPVFPVFANFRAVNLNKRNSAYFSLGLGYTFYADPYIEGLGFIANPEIGLNFKVSEHSAFNVGFGYEMQKNFSGYENLGAISLTIGISF